MYLTDRKTEQNLDRLRGLFAYVFVIIIAISLISYGSVQRSPFLVVACAMFVITLLTAIILGEPLRGRLIFRLALALLVGVSGWIWLQGIRIADNPFANSAWIYARQISGVSVSSISVAPADTQAATLRFAVPIITFMTGLMLCTSDTQAEKLLARLIILGAALAALGLAQFLLTPHQLLFTEKIAYLDSLTSVFVNRNTAATFLGLTALGLVTICYKLLDNGAMAATLSWLLGGKKPGSLRKRLAPLFYILMLMLVIAALLLSKSRAGVTSTFAAMLFLVPYLAAIRPTGQSSGRRRSGHRPYARALRIGVSVVVMLAATFFLSSRIIMRIETGVEDDRFCIVPGIVEMIKGHPYVGSGFGTFSNVFPAYRNESCVFVGVWERAHNFYLEGLSGLGIIFPLAALMVVLTLGSALYIGIRDRQRYRLYPGLGVAAVLLVGLHAVLDFSLQISGFAMFFCAFMAPILSISVARRTREAKTPLAPAPASRSLTEN